MDVHEVDRSRQSTIGTGVIAAGKAQGYGHAQPINLLVAGYVNAATATDPRARVANRVAIEAFAATEGFFLVGTFEQVHLVRPGVALRQLQTVVRRWNLVAVIVPDETHLGRHGPARSATRQWLENHLRVPILTATRSNLPSGMS